MNYQENKSYVEKQFSAFSSAKQDGYNYAIQVKGIEASTNWLSIDESQLQAIKHILIGEPKVKTISNQILIDRELAQFLVDLSIQELAWRKEDAEGDGFAFASDDDRAEIDARIEQVEVFKKQLTK